MRFIEVIEEFSKSKHLHEGDFVAMAREIVQKGAEMLGVGRTNVWLFSPDNSSMENIVTYDSGTKDLFQEPTLEAKNFPKYFRFIANSDILVCKDAVSEPVNAELVSTYIQPYGITSMIDVPFRCMGVKKGVICFEHTGSMRDWTVEEQSFCQSLAQLLSLALEAKERNAMRNELQSSLQEKEVLISELSHRVKNNMAVMLGLIRSEAQKCDNPELTQHFDNIIDKVYSIAEVQNQLHQSKSFDDVQLDEYLSTLAQRIRVTYGGEMRVDMSMDLVPMKIDVTQAIPCGLIVNEAITNAFKYAFDRSKENELRLVLENDDDAQVHISISDNGEGFGAEEYVDGIGITLMQELAEQLDGRLEVETGDEGTTVQLSFKC